MMHLRCYSQRKIMKSVLLHLVCSVVCSLVLMGLLFSCSGAKVQVLTPYVQYGMASWYGKDFHGRRTANGEVFDMFQLTAAHKSAPLGIHAIVTNLDTGRSVRVRINDRGPFVDGRVLDLSYAAARQLGMLKSGLARVKIRFLPETVPRPTFVVQVGSYRSQHNAMRVHKTVAAQFSNVWIAMAREGSETFYRVRLGHFHSRADAEQTARRIQALGYATQVIPLSAPLSSVRPPVDHL
jgi:rare lipoprotein A